MSLPEGYKEGVERVSNIVSFVYPFAGEGKKRYLQWIYKTLGDKVSYTGNFDNQDAIELLKEFPEFGGEYDIGKMLEIEGVYIKEACDVGTYVHLLMEEYMMGHNLIIGNPLYETHRDVITGGLDYIDDLKSKWSEDEVKWEPEQVVKDDLNRFQGTIDLIRVNEETKTVWLYDWKTWGIAKHKWGLPNTYRKPYDKLKKLALQLSLYAETYRQKGYTIGGIYGVWLHETGCYEYKLDTYSTEDINAILEKMIRSKNFLPTDITLLFKYNPMQIEIQTVIPGEAYSKASVILEANDVEKFKTPQEAIETGITLQKYLLSKYK